MRDLQHYSIGEVAALLGVSPHAIRAWERRYGILSPERGLNRHRRYSAEDIEFLRDVKRTADINGTSLRLALEVVNGSLELPTATTNPAAQPNHAEVPGADSPPLADVWRAVRDAVPNLIMLLDTDGRVVEANVAVARLLGVVRQRIAGLKFIGLVDPFDRMKASRLYRPQLRAVSSWELNLETKEGVKLFSFSAWPVAAAENTYLAVVGHEMFRRETRTEPSARAAVAGNRGTNGPASMHALQSLFDNLPFGVAVTTVGREPRIVYSNRSLNQELGLRAGSLLGRRVSEVLGQELVTDGRPMDAQGSARRSPRRTTRTVVFNTHHALRTVVIRPMFSANDSVTSCLIVVMPQASLTDEWRRTSSSNGHAATATKAPGYRKPDRSDR